MRVFQDPLQFISTLFGRGTSVKKEQFKTSKHAAGNHKKSSGKSELYGLSKHEIKKRARIRHLSKRK